MNEGDWVEVKPEYDIAPMFRNNKPTRGRIDSIDDGVAIVFVPIGEADVDEHSQAVPYQLHALTVVDH